MLPREEDSREGMHGWVSDVCPLSGKTEFSADPVEAESLRIRASRQQVSRSVVVCVLSPTPQRDPLHGGDGM